MKYLIYFLLIILGVILLISEKLVGIHVFFVTSVFVTYFLSAPQRRVGIFLILGLIHDAIFWLPIGFSFLVTVPFILYFPIISRFVKSRMIAFFSAVSSTSILLLMITAKEIVPASHIIFSIIGSMVATVFIYFFVLNHPSFTGLVEKKSSWKFT